MNAEQFKKWHDSLPEVEPTEEEREAIRQAKEGMFCHYNSIDELKKDIMTDDETEA